MTSSPERSDLPPGLSSVWRLCKLGYRHEPGLLLAAFLTQVGALQTAPILIAVVTAFLTMEGVKYLLASRKQARKTAAKPAAPA